MSTMINSIENLCKSDERVPLQYRKNATAVKEFVGEIENNGYIVTNWHVQNLINIYKSRNDEASVVRSITVCGEAETYDIEVDHAHSYVANGIIAHNTMNLANNATEEMVSDIYIKSWKDNLKGITVYRDGCRGGVFVSADNKKEEKEKKDNFVENGTAKRRPKVLEAKVLRFSNKGEKWVALVGMLDDKPYELFTGILEKLNIPSWVEEGKLIKNYEEVEVEGEIKKKSRYDFCYADKDGYRVCVEGISRIFNPEFWNYGKLVSGLLRHNMPISYIIKVISSLKLDDESINTWKNGVVRALRKFGDSIPEEIEGEKCPECGGRLIREGGCIHCADCGWSRCG